VSEHGGSTNAFTGVTFAVGFSDNPGGTLKGSGAATEALAAASLALLAW